MRITKDYEDRKKEIIDAAEKLFYIKGFDQCTINDILKQVAIAKGTFYYYFKSKNEVLDAIVFRVTEKIMIRVQAIVDHVEMGPVEKLMNVFMSMKVEEQVDTHLLEEMHKGDNTVLHQRTLNQMIKFLAPALTLVVEEGIEKKIWNCQYPLQYMQIFLASALTLTDEGIFEIDEASQTELMIALITMLEKMLEVPTGMFLKLFEQAEGDNDELDHI